MMTKKEAGSVLWKQAPDNLKCESKLELKSESQSNTESESE